MPRQPRRAPTWPALAASVGAAWLGGCNVPLPPGGTGGTDVEAGACGRGLVVVASDYQSTNVSLLGVDGTVLSGSFLSSASAQAGLSAPLSGDVAVPTARLAGPELVLIDRYPAAVLTFVDVASARVRSQLAVGTGYAANPQDFLAFVEDKAFVSRLDPNPTAGAEAYDEGSDLLVIDPTAPAIVGRVDLTAALAGLEPDLFVRPSRLGRIADRLVVLASPSSRDFVRTAEARLVVVDPLQETVEQVLALTGLHGCSGLAISEASDALAVACSGRFEGGSTPTIAESGIVLLSVSVPPAAADGGPPPPLELAVVGQWPAAELVARPIGFSVDFADEDRLVGTAFGRFGDASEPAEPDVLFELRLGNGTVRPLLESASIPFSLGEVRCTGPCGRCYAADAERGVVHELALGAEGLELVRSIVADQSIGLPPRLVGRF